MQPFLQWLASNPYALLFGVVLGAVLLGKLTIKGFGLGTVACAILVGAALSAGASTMGVRLAVDDSARAIFYYLFVYGVGLRLGPAFVESLRGEDLKFTMLAVICSMAGLACAVGFTRLWEMPAASSAGILAGSMTMSTAIGTAEEAVRQGAFALPQGQRIEDAVGTIAFSYVLTYIWGTVGIALICKYLPRWWGIDIKAEAKKFEEQLGVANVDDAGITGWRPLAVRAYRLTNDTLTGWTVQQFTRKYSQYKVLNVLRVEPVRRAPIPASAAVVVEDEALMLAAAGGASTTRLHESGPAVPRAQRGVLPQTIYTKLGTSDELALRQGDIVTLGGRTDQLAANLALIGPEVADPSALNVPLDRAEIVVTNRMLEGKELVELRNEDFVGEVAVHHIERLGVPVPMGLHTKIERFDVFFVAGMKSGVDRLARMLGKVARPSTSTDLVTLSAGMILGLAIGSISFPLGGAMLGLGSAGGLLVSGVVVSSAVSRLRFFGNTPSAARNMLEDLGLVAFVAIVAINAGASVLTLSGDLAMKIIGAGFVTCALPPILAWVIGLHVMKINPAVLVGAVGGARSHPGPAREAARETASSVPWTGFPIGHAVSGILLTVFGYVAMILSKL